MTEYLNYTKLRSLSRYTNSLTCIITMISYLVVVQMYVLINTVSTQVFFHAIETFIYMPESRVH